MQSIPEAFLAHSLQGLSPEDQLLISRLGLSPTFSESLLFSALLRLSIKSRIFSLLAILMCVSAIAEDPHHFSGWRLLLYAGFDWLLRKWEILSSRPWLLLWSIFFAALLVPTSPLFALYLFCFSVAIDWTLQHKYYKACLPIAWLLTLPLALLCFPTFSPLASMLSMCISPFFALLAVLGSAGTLLSSYHLNAAATALKASLEILLENTIFVFHSLAMPSYWVPWTSAMILFFLLALCLKIRNRILSCAIACFLWILYPLCLPTHGAIVFNVGQGDSIGLLQETNSPFLVDAGPPPNWHSGLAPIDKQLEVAGIGTIEGILLTHPDLDHYGGIDALLARHPLMQGIWIHPELLHSEKADKVLTMIERHQAKIHFLGSDDMPYPGLRCRLAPVKNSNEISPLCKFTSTGQHTILLTGDMDAASEEFFLQEDRSFLATEALKVAHHGSKTSSSAIFLAASIGKEAFISVGAHNHYGHPTKETLYRLEQAGMDIHRTDLEGNIYWLQWPILERFLPGRSIVASNSLFGLLRSASSATLAPE